MTFYFVEQFTRDCVVNKYVLRDTEQDLLSIGPEANAPNLIRLLCLGWRHRNLVLPHDLSLHFKFELLNY